jgi:hypothetical protein
MMLYFNSMADEEACYQLFDLCLHAKRLDLEASDLTFRRILDASSLNGLADWVEAKNPSRDAPYHGAIHEKLMTCFAFMAASYADIGWSQRRCIVAAACLHDFDHTGVLPEPAKDDTINIQRALAGFDLVNKTSPLMFNQAERDLIVSLIQCTRYPYLAEPGTDLEKIMRDADMCMPYVSQPIRDQLFLGLHQELAASGRVYTLDEFADGVVAFYDAGTRHTAWANAYFEKHNLSRSLQELSANLRMASANHRPQADEPEQDR